MGPGELTSTGRLLWTRVRQPWGGNLHSKAKAMAVGAFARVLLQLSSELENDV